MRRNRIAFVENAGRIVVAQKGHQALEFVVQPAHLEPNPAFITQALQKWMPRMSQANRVSFAEAMCALPLIRIADLPLNDNTLCARRFVVAPEKILDFRAPLAQAQMSRYERGSHG